MPLFFGKGGYLRGKAQVRTWHPACDRDFKHGCKSAQGALENPAPEGKSGRHDLNVRPLRPERSALARLSYAPIRDAAIATHMGEA